MVFLSIAARIGRQPAPNDERVRPLQKFNTDRACGSAGHKISVELLGMSTLPPAPLRRSSRHRRTERTNSTRCALSSFISPFSLERYSEIRHGWSKCRSVERGALLGDNGDSSSVRKDAIHP